LAKIAKANLRRLRLPLYTPYRLSYRTFTEFEPFFLELTDEYGNKAFSDAHVSPGSSSETRDGAWKYCLDRLGEINESDVESYKTSLMNNLDQSKVATTLLMTTLEALGHSDWLKVNEHSEQELIVPINASEPSEIDDELQDLFRKGFSTFKVKVGKDVQADINRSNAILKLLDGRGSIRLDANRAYSRDDAIRFANGITHSGVDLFEQPCGADAWDDNAEVARNSPIPLMLDEPICSLKDIDRAAEIPNVKFCKVKLKRFGSLSALVEGIERVHANGMLAVLGDGLGSEINNWMEASIASRLIKTKGEYNGFLKHIDKLFKNPLPFSNGRIVLEKGYVPVLDMDAIERVTTEQRTIDY
jgi:L-alanine-DL-glutamate epimerase-like enolase superfamily enzyme